jgi:hypothetical protein
MPNVEKPVERSPSNNFGESKNKTPIKPRTKQIPVDMRASLPVMEWQLLKLK